MGTTGKGRKDNMDRQIRRHLIIQAAANDLSWDGGGELRKEESNTRDF